jgi:hypothetical protein
MPVSDHPIHPSTQKGDDFRYGCWNGARIFEGYPAPNRNLNLLTGNYDLVAVWIPYVMSTGCKYDLSHKDPNCRGCKHVQKQETS